VYCPFDGKALYRRSRLASCDIWAKTRQTARITLSIWALLFCRLPHNPRSGLCEILAWLSFAGMGLANMGIKRCLSVILFCLSRSPKTGNQPDPSTRPTTPSGERLGFDPKKFAFCHIASLRPPCGLVHVVADRVIFAGVRVKALPSGRVRIKVISSK